MHTILQIHLDEYELTTKVDRLAGTESLRYALNETKAADKIDLAISKALSEGYRTKDISMFDAKEVCSTSEMGSIIANYAAQCKL